MICIGLILGRRFQLLSLRCRRLSATGSGKPKAVAAALVRHKGSLLSDQRGAVAFETLIVWVFLMMGLLLPLADVAIAGFQYISAWQALRAFGQYIQYNNPPNPADPGTWKSGIRTTFADYIIGDLQVICGDASAVCSSANVTLQLPNGSIVPAPKYFTFSTTITLAPMVLRRMLCPSTCTYTLPYSERFQ